ncbi:MAG: anti-sigma factor [Actinomycetota bacterium]|nr:anti-sigma factor [Actinomycetota bacterium]
MSRRSIDRHEEIAELLGAFALNAVDPDERERVEAHLAECPKCRAELADHIFVATTLGNQGGDAPDGVWDRIIGELDQAPPPMRLQLPTGAPGRVVSLDERRRNRLRTAVAGAAVAASVAVIAGLGVQVVRQDDRIAELQTAMRGEVIQDAATAALADPASQRVQLASADGSPVVTAVLLPTGTGYLLTDRLPALDPGRTYQLWGQTSGGLVSLGVLGAQPNEVVAFEAHDPVAALAITDEESGGVQQSKNAPVVIGQFD